MALSTSLPLLLICRIVHHVVEEEEKGIHVDVCVQLFKHLCI